ncbi:hypothetical protein AOQ84DRAFT_442104 [Glonium stellatum]|uniref:SP-RING-type domain-containing protein n=1 Tax=Glonium stellatum TaxID=574774 RepID=A0A8E2JPM0_9PEZI|nr:hypothetical protein AOQ84DRAFT_442104 [Glonium stellatum]
MASRHRQSTAGPSSQRRNLPIVEFPSYEPPTRPPNNAAQRALNDLHREHSLTKLKKHYVDANDAITSTAGIVNDYLYEREESQRKRKARRANQGLEEDNEGAEELEQLRQKVDRMTQRMEESVRKIIDGQAFVDNLEDSLQYLRQNAVNLTQQQSQTQETQRSQRRRQRRGEGSGSEDEDESPGPTPLNGEGVEITGPSVMLENRLQASKDKYQALSHRTRYAQHNSYIGFRRVVHDAQNPGEDAPPLPHPSTWFTESGSPAPGITSRDRRAGAGAEDDSDDDIAIARERISTKCPLTLQEFKDPVTSEKCPHTFEKTAILDMIRQSTNKLGVGPRAGEKAVHCPVPGCNEMLTTPDLKPDPLLVRKIRRIQQSRNAPSDEEDDDDERDTNTSSSHNQRLGSTMRHAQSLLSSPAATRPGGRGQGRSRGTRDSHFEAQQPFMSSVVVDLGGSDSDEEMEE